MQNPALVEISGLAWSRRDRNLLWANNDSGDSARLFALGLDGSDRGTVVVDGAAAIDWEDIALQRGPKKVNVLWAGDIGDNAAGRSAIVVYRFPEPPAPGAGATTTVTADAITLRYADQPHDAEAMLVDDRSGDLVIVTKEPQEPAGVYRGRAKELKPGALVTLERVGDLTLPPDEGLAGLVAQLGAFGGLASRITAADASGAGKVAAVRSYGGVALFPWPKGASLADALAATGCAAPAPADPAHPQGEAVALSPDGRAFVTASEGASPPIVRVDAGS